MTESEETTARSGVRSVAGRHASKESEFVDMDAVRRRKFLQHNVFGHSSDSTVQRLLYGTMFGMGGSSGQEDGKRLFSII
jgi:hypothetical protein